MRIFTGFFCCLLCLSVMAQPGSKKTFLVFSDRSTPLAYNQIGSFDVHADKPAEVIYEPKKNGIYRRSEFNAFEGLNTLLSSVDSLRMPMAGAVACMAFDARSNRLFYIPQQLSQLRYLDLNASAPSFTYFENQSLNLLHDKNDAANQISRMTIGADGFGYALSNDAEHLIKFSTGGSPVIQDLGVLVDNPSNKVIVRSSCTSWGGDLVADVNNNLYLITGYNHVFKITLPGKHCDYIGQIQHLPEGFTSNGAAVDENGELIIGSGSMVNNSNTSLYKVNLTTLQAVPLTGNLSLPGNISDMASCNLLFQKNTAAASNASFMQSAEANSENTQQISVFPNPVTQRKFQIRTSNITQAGMYNMLLTDLSGKLVMEGKMNMGLKANTHTFTIPGANARGVYFIQIADNFNRIVYSR